LPGIKNLQTERSKDVVFSVILTIYLLSNSMQYGLSLAERHLSEPEVTAMQWVGENTPANGRFLVITGDQTAFCDPVNEWFPSLAKRESLTTVQGSEWLLGNDFARNMFQIQELQGCIDDNLECLEKKSELLKKPFDHIYLSISPNSKNCTPSDTLYRTTRSLVTALENTDQYQVIFRSEKVMIFRRR
jgi:hypothetical protein